jgi:outer membrane protein OmpA-like peptidoglycan-associated protein
MREDILMLHRQNLVRILLMTTALVTAAGCEQPAPPPQAAAPTCFNHEVHFATGSVLMDANDVQTINTVTQQASAPDARVILVGKTDTVGSRSYNMALSKRRADQVNKALIANGVMPNRISWFFTGEAQPVVQTADQEADAANRVVRIAVGVDCPRPL